MGAAGWMGSWGEGVGQGVVGLVLMHVGVGVRGPRAGASPPSSEWTGVWLWGFVGARNVGEGGGPYAGKSTRADGRPGLQVRR